jgi:methionyl aminopeptidase
MTIECEDQLDGLKRIGMIVARTLEIMRGAAEPGMTTAELDAIGAAVMDQEGAKSAPKTS